MQRRWTAVLLVSLVLCGIALRFYRLGANSLWIDEFATLRIAMLPFREIFAANLGNNSFEPPFYFWLIHGLVRVLGSSEFTIRLPSAIAGCLTIPAVWLLMRDLSCKPRTAHLTAALLTFSPLHLWYSQEARPYAILVLLACFATTFLARALRGGSRAAWLGFTGFSVLSVCSHLVGCVLLPVAWGCVLLDPRRRQLLRPLLGSTVAVVACTAPLFLSIALATARIPGTGSPPRAVTGLEVPYTLLTYVAGYSFGPSVRDVQNSGPTVALAAHPVESALAILAVTGLLLLIARHWRSCPRELLLLFAGYIGAMFLGSVVTGKAYSIRYTLPGLVGFLGLIAVASQRLRAPLARAVPACLLMLFAWADAQWFFDRSYWKEDSRGAVAWLAARLPPGSRVAVAPAYASRILSYYAGELGAKLEVIPVEERWTGAPAALVLTRLHHAPDHTRLVEEFRRMAGVDLVRHQGIGYDIYVPPDAP